MKTPRPAIDNGLRNPSGPHELPTKPSEMSQVWPSASLLQGQKTVVIEHNGALYRLQSTRAGKLILTK